MALTLEQQWAQQYQNLLLSRQKSQSLVSILSSIGNLTNSQQNSLDQAKKEWLSADYSMIQFLGTGDTLVNKANALQIIINNLPTDQMYLKSGLDAQVLSYMQDATKFSSLTIQNDWNSSYPQANSFSIGNQIYNNLGAPPIWDTTKIGGAFNANLNTFVGVLSQGVVSLANDAGFFNRELRLLNCTEY